ncbi:MAG: hypothetical protein AB7G08_28375 [Hyphomicrobiaceae bacterium]
MLLPLTLSTIRAALSRPVVPAAIMYIVIRRARVAKRVDGTLGARARK